MSLHASLLRLFAKEFERLTRKQLETTGTRLPPRGWVRDVQVRTDSQSLPPHASPWPRPQTPYKGLLRKFPGVLLPSLHSRYSMGVLSSCIAPRICFSTRSIWSIAPLDDLLRFAFWSLHWEMSLLILHPLPSPA